MPGLWPSYQDRAPRWLGPVTYHLTRQPVSREVEVLFASSVPRSVPGPAAITAGSRGRLRGSLEAP